ncbi:MAG TPA: hypothetical protein VLQ52_02430 [Coriobacteriia bacterium]|nr:hypothetical protein [Coriobacteriia bacterium]
MEDEARSTEPADARRSVPARIARAMVVLLVVIVALLAVARVFIRPIPPDQQAPVSHFGEPCVLCHLVTVNADPVPLR